MKMYTELEERVEFDIQTFRTLVLSSSGFHKIRLKEGPTLSMGVSAITATHAS